jgi:cytochrome c-type biogenesis protein CcmF
MALGITGSSVYEEGQGIVLAVGDSYEISGYTLVYNGLIANTATDRMSVMADIDITRDGRITGKLQPVKWFHTVQQQVVTEVAIRSNLIEDLYVILDDWDDTQNAAFTILVNPVVSWIWIGGFLLLAGGLLSFSAAPRKSLEGD